MDAVEDAVAGTPEQAREKGHVYVLLHRLAVGAVWFFVTAGKEHVVHERDDGQAAGKEAVALYEGGFVQPGDDLAQALVEGGIVLLETGDVVVVFELFDVVPGAFPEHDEGGLDEEVGVERVAAAVVDGSQGVFELRLLFPQFELEGGKEEVGLA